MHKSACTVGSRMRTYGTVRSIGSTCRCSLWVQYGNNCGIGQALITCSVIFTNRNLYVLKYWSLRYLLIWLMPVVSLLYLIPSNASHSSYNLQ
jgi:hypothetical protein